MSTGQPAVDRDRQQGLLALAAALRPELHRYCARLMGSVIDGEDVVQDTFARALVALDELCDVRQLRPWLYRIAHNRALDVLRSRGTVVTEPIEAALEIVDHVEADPMEMLIHKEAIETAVSRFTELPVLQRSVIILKDVLGESLAETATLLCISVDAVKAHLARGRAQLRRINAEPNPLPVGRIASAAVVRYVSLFNQRDWDGLRALLADDVRLQQSMHPPRSGAVAVGTFFTIYGKADGLLLRPAWVEDREVIAVFEHRTALKPIHFMWLEWREARITFIRDYRYVGYVTNDAGLALAPEAKPLGLGTGVS